MTRLLGKGTFRTSAIALLAVMAVAATLAAAPPDSGQARLAERGEAIFQQKCSACHTVGGGDRPMGPDLAGVLERRDPAWVERFIREPGKVIAGGDPVAQQLLQQYRMPMPAMGLNDDELAALMAFLAYPEEAAHHAGEAAVPAPRSAVPAGDAARGKDLYVGTRALANGGAPCLACHGIAGAGLGLAAGANYGPDLTNLTTDYGAEGVASILQTLPFPSMEPIYAARPLIDAEQRDLGAFFAAVAGAQPAAVGVTFLRQAGGALLALAVVLYIFGRGRLRSVRRQLVEQARQPSVRGETR